MDNYDLLTLSWIEFENLTKDLLQREFNLYIETFTPGKDTIVDQNKKIKDLFDTLLLK